MLSDIQQKIYNDYLRALGQANNRSYKPRKNFNDLDEETKIYLYRLELFFNQFSHINPYNFFIASFKYRELKFLKLSNLLISVGSDFIITFFVCLTKPRS